MDLGVGRDVMLAEAGAVVRWGAQELVASAASEREVVNVALLTGLLRVAVIGPEEATDPDGRGFLGEAWGAITAAPTTAETTAVVPSKILRMFKLSSRAGFPRPVPLTLPAQTGQGRDPLGCMAAIRE
jgi:hypothetical protein